MGSLYGSTHQITQLQAQIKEIEVQVLVLPQSGLWPWHMIIALSHRPFIVKWGSGKCPPFWENNVYKAPAGAPSYSQLSMMLWSNCCICFSSHANKSPIHTPSSHITSSFQVEGYNKSPHLQCHGFFLWNSIKFTWEPKQDSIHTLIYSLILAIHA